jgi:hypothetical protein
MALPPTAHLVIPPKILTQNESSTAVAAVATVAQKKVEKTMDSGNPFDTKLETTEKNTTTNGMGSVDDLLDFSFPGFSQTPSNTVLPSSFSLFDFSSPSTWSQTF